MTITVETIISASFTKSVYTIDPLATTSAVQQIAYSIPVPFSKSAYVECRFICNNGTYTSASGGFAMAVFLRGASGDVSRTATSSATGLIASILSNFLVVQPSVDIVATASTQTIDLKVTGLTATALAWHLELTVFMNN